MSSPCCSLFGEDVLLLLDMDRANTPNCIQVSDAALGLINSRPGQFTPVCKVVSGGQEVQMHALVQQQVSCLWPGKACQQG